VEGAGACFAAVFNVVLSRSGWSEGLLRSANEVANPLEKGKADRHPTLN